MKLLYFTLVMLLLSTSLVVAVGRTKASTYRVREQRSALHVFKGEGEKKESVDSPSNVLSASATTAAASAPKTQKSSQPKESQEMEEKMRVAKEAENDLYVHSIALSGGGTRALLAANIALQELSASKLRTKNTKLLGLSGGSWAVIVDEYEKKLDKKYSFKSALEQNFKADRKIGCDTGFWGAKKIADSKHREALRLWTESLVTKVICPLATNSDLCVQHIVSIQPEAMRKHEISIGFQITDDVSSYHSKYEGFCNIGHDFTCYLKSNTDAKKVIRLSNKFEGFEIYTDKLREASPAEMPWYFAKYLTAASLSSSAYYAAASSVISGTVSSTLSPSVDRLAKGVMKNLWAFISSKSMFVPRSTPHSTKYNSIRPIGFLKETSSAKKLFSGMYDAGLKCNYPFDLDWLVEKKGQETSIIIDASFDGFHRELKNCLAWWAKLGLVEEAKTEIHVLAMQKKGKEKRWKDFKGSFVVRIYLKETKKIIYLVPLKGGKKSNIDFVTELPTLQHFIAPKCYDKGMYSLLNNEYRNHLKTCVKLLKNSKETDLQDYKISISWP